MEESQIEDLIDDPEQYQGYGVFVVPVSARWKFLAENTKGKPAVGGEPAKNIGQLIDEAMDAVMKANPTLVGRCRGCITRTTSTSAGSVS